MAGGSPATARRALSCLRSYSSTAFQRTHSWYFSDCSSAGVRAGRTSSWWRAKAAGTDRIHSLMASDLIFLSSSRISAFRWVLASLWMSSNRLSWAARYRGSHWWAYRVGHF